ncbi:galactose-3-O-sulfotransferase 2-like [Leucoraja erinacea]|uniref:galactose-3-O-sulfotransferase 2-like n=1 Tax=Leucoraja erinaceus TaxID=7782 RepID=UPI0024552626|nr:galactose-3-O-sulfotransferase 2-like [Leucoraja erinacea]
MRWTHTRTFFPQEADDSPAPYIPHVVDQYHNPDHIQPWLSPAMTQRERSLEKPCRPKTHLFFLKTHKTASSTVLNIMYRFGEARNLTFALPVAYQFGYPQLFDTRTVKSYNAKNNQEYHIICNHMRFYKPQVEKLMPNDTFYFSILRSPVTWMESSFAYYKDTARAFSNVKSLEQFLEDPWSHYLPTSRGSHYARNCMWFDFGFDHNADDTPAYVDSVISKIANTFHLILIAEYFDQSMVLLQEALCWDLDDVLSFKLNPRGNGTVVPLSETTADQIPAWNSLDWKLYLHFNRTFWQKVDLFGRQRMSEEVVLLQEARQKMRDLCLERGRPVDPSQILDKTIKPFQFGQARIQGYNLNTNLTPATRERCLRMILPELHYKDLLDAKAHPPAAH